MKILKRIGVPALLLFFGCFVGTARGQTGVIPLTVTSTPTPIVTNMPANYVVIQENSATPTNAYTITLPGGSTGITYSAGTKFIFAANTGGFIAGQTIGTITLVSGSASFIGIESLKEPTLPQKTLSSGGTACTATVPFESAGAVLYSTGTNCIGTAMGYITAGGNRTFIISNPSAPSPLSALFGFGIQGDDQSASSELNMVSPAAAESGGPQINMTSIEPDGVTTALSAHISPIQGFCNGNDSANGAPNACFHWGGFLVPVTDGYQGSFNPNVSGDAEVWVDANTLQLMCERVTATGPTDPIAPCMPGGGIGGSIANTQIAFGSGSDTIQGSNNATLDLSGNLLAASLTGSGLTSGHCVQATTGGLLTTVSGACGTSTGTITATGSPASGNLTKFSGGTSITNGDLSGDVTTSGTLATTVTAINGVNMAGLATGILKNTTSTGVPSIAIAADFPTLNQNTTGNAATATALASSPSQCSGGTPVATGIAANGNANCTAAGGTVTSIATTAPITGGPLTTTGTIACGSCVTATSPGAGIAHFAGSTQAVTSSAVNLASADVTGTTPIANGGTNATNNPIKRLLAPWGVCNQTVSGASWGLPASGPAVPSCPSPLSNGLVLFTLNFAQNEAAYDSAIVPADWQSFGLAKIWFTSTDVTAGHTIIFQLQTACVTPNAKVIINPTFNTAQAFSTVTIPSSPISGESYSATISSTTGTGCSAGAMLYLKFSRTGTDTSTDTAVALVNALELDYNGTYQ